MHWIPTTPEDMQHMLRVIGVQSIEDLFRDIPVSVRMKQWNLPDPMSEMEVLQYFQQLSRQNIVDKISFLGGGFYDHYIPAVVDYLSQRGEFVTAYTPYQPECAQGTLQAIYEYQTALCRLTDMEVANASLYDGGTAIFEAITMSIRITGRRKVTLLPGLNPIYEQIIKTHTANLDLTIHQATDYTDSACVVGASPDFFGNVWDFTDWAQQAKHSGTLFVMQFYPISLGLMKSPGEMGVDIAVAEGQSLGLPLSFGGPYLGLFATRKEYIRRMPGRIAGMTTDTQGRRGFVLTLQAREQHIRREKAMSNICSNQALCALRALIYLCEVGKRGICDIAEACYAKAEYLKEKLQKLGKIVNPGVTFNEFVIRLPKPAEMVVQRMAHEGFLAGIPLRSFLLNLGITPPVEDMQGVRYGDEGDLLVAVTERRTREELEKYADTLEKILQG